MAPARFIRLLLLAAAITTTPLVPFTRASEPTSKQGDSEWDSTGSPNGRFWRDMDSGVSKADSQFSKLMFVIAFKHGMAKAAAMMSQDYEQFKVTQKLLWPSLTYGEVCDALDRFYAVPENGNIAIANALTVIAKRVSGKLEAEIESTTAELRAKAAK